MVQVDMVHTVTPRKGRDGMAYTRLRCHIKDIFRSAQADTKHGSNVLRAEL